MVRPLGLGQWLCQRTGQAAIAEARARLGLQELRAFAKADNAASCRVLEKAGFPRQRYVPELERYLYRHALDG